MFLTLSRNESNFPERSRASLLSNMCASLIVGQRPEVALEVTGWCIFNSRTFSGVIVPTRERLPSPHLCPCLGFSFSVILAI